MASEPAKESVLQFAPFHSAVDEGFWHQLSSLKLNKLGLEDSPIPITGFYAPCSHSQVSNYFTLSADSFAHLSDQPLESSVLHGNRNRCPISGVIYNKNTLESFQLLDKRSLLITEVRKIWDDICSGEAVEDCSKLPRFLVISYADLKSWTFHYWFAFPALVLDPPAVLVDIMPASQWFNKEEAESVSAACNKWRSADATAGVPFFLISIDSSSYARIWHLKEWDACQASGVKLLFGFYDPCHLRQNPGWPLRNFLALICSRWAVEKVHFFCYREGRGFADLELSIVGETLISFPQGWDNDQFQTKAVGWELSKGKRISKSVNLANFMDPTRLAVSAADLNLKLMRWRVMPSLDLSVLSNTKCLLLGAGTLGCQVARMLMAWGIRKITILDCGKVSMSNPLRQSLYTFNNCLNGGELKASAAVNSLKRIFPAVEVEGITMVIPIPGHLVSVHVMDSVHDDCKKLYDLVSSHDVIFLLTDTRTLDEQCTVTRPGLAPIASALDVELLVGILHHPHGIYAEAEVSGSGQGPFGILPHQIRGSLSNFSQMALVGHASKSCTSCSNTVLYEYRKRGVDFIMDAINQPIYLEEVTGLTELMKSAASFIVDWDVESDDDGESCV